MDLKGIFTALVTPFNRRSELDLSQIPHLIEFQRSAGVDGLVVCGTNGEGPSLSVPERMGLLENVLQHRRGLKVIAATGAAALADTLALTAHASDVGCDAVLVLPPFFFKCAGPEGFARSFEKVARVTKVPIILYSIPQLSGVPITSSLLRLLKDCQGLCGVKESSGDRAAAVEILTEHPDYSLYVGSDDLAAELLTLGAAGIISGTANAFPELLIGVWRAHRDGKGLAEAQERLNAAISIVIQYPMVANMKAVLAIRGIADLDVRLPLVALTQSERNALREKLLAADLLQQKGA